MKKKILVAGLGIGLAIAGAGLLTACGGNNTPDGLLIHTEFDTTYYVGQNLDVSGGVLDYTKNGKTTQITVTDDMISGFTTESAGTRDMIVTYQGETLVISYTVSDVPTKSDVSTSRVYKSNNVKTDGSEGYFYAKFFYIGEDLYFEVIGKDGSVDDTTYAYTSTIWDTATEKEGLLGGGKVTAEFDLSSGSWTMTYTAETKGSVLGLQYTFLDVKDNNFTMKIDRDAFYIGSTPVEATHYVLNMTKLSC